MPIELADFLEDFFDNVPNGLPLVRKTGHQIDLIQGVRFPNKVAHRMTPTESDELNR